MLNNPDFFQNTTFNIIRALSWGLYIFILFGITTTAPQYLNDLNYYVQIYVSLFLIYRFNPFRNVKYTELDVKITFAAGVFLLFTTAIGSLMKTYIANIKNITLNI
jgi:hypothetical protein